MPKPFDFSLYYPLKAGLSWVYRYSDPELPGVVQAAYARRRVLSTRPTKEGVLGSLEERIETDGGTRTRNFEVLVSPEGIREEERWILRGAPGLGNLWRDGADSWRVSGVAETVTVPAGTFTGCLLLTYSNEDTGGGAVILLPGLGVIRVEQNGERGPYLYELKDSQGF